MEVIHRLPRPSVHVEHGSVALLMDIRLHCKFLGNLKHLAEKCTILGRHIV
jgi:hypothetical protein